MWKELACLTHLLPQTFLRENDTSETQLLFPSHQELQTCLSINQNSHSSNSWLDSFRAVVGPVKFCLTSIRFNLPFSPIKLSLTFGACLPLSCDSHSFHILFDNLCQIPSCSQLIHSDLVSLCSQAQPLLCGPLDRTAFQHQISQQCFTPPLALRAPTTDVASAADVASANADPFSTAAESERNQTLEQSVRILRRWQHQLDSLQQPPVHLSPNGTSHQTAAASSTPSRVIQRRLAATSPDSRDTVLTFEDLDAFLSCGFPSVKAPALWTRSGKLSSLGNWHECPPRTHGPDIINPMLPSHSHKSPGHFCTLRFMDLLVAGRCVPNECTDESLEHLLRLICSLTTDTERNLTCLDLINVVPLDLCFSVQIAGCQSGPHLQPNLDPMLLLKLPETSKEILVSDDMVQDSRTALYATRQSLTAADSFSDLVSLLTVLPLSKAVNDGLAEVAKSMALNSRIEARHQRREEADRLNLLSRLAASKSESAGEIGVKSYCSFDNGNTWRDKLRKWTAAGILLALFPILPFLAWLLEPVAFLDSRSPNCPSSSTSYRWESVVASFDIRQNWKAFKKTGQNVAHGDFPHLCGLRAISILWVILGHSFTFLLLEGPVFNLQSMLALTARFDMQFVISGTFAVDSFFFFTGFLVAAFGSITIDKVINASQSTSPLDFLKIFLLTVIHRYIRLGGGYFVVLTLYLLGLPYISNGPMWPVVMDTTYNGIHDSGGCSTNVWANYLFLNNLTAEQGLCFPWSWYLANDFQFFVVSTLLLLLRHHSKRAFRHAYVLLLTGSLLAGLVTVLQYDLHVNNFSLSADANRLDPMTRFSAYYMRPWCRIPAHLVGLVSGFLYQGNYFDKYVLCVPKKRGEADSLLLVYNRAGVIPTNAADLAGGGEKDDDGKAANASLSDTPQHLLILPAAEEEAASVPSSRAKIGMVHLLVLAIMATLVFAPYGPNGAAQWPRWLDVSYVVLSRPLWCVCIGWWTVSLSYIQREDKVEGQLAKRHSHVLNDKISILIARILTLRIFVLTASLVYGVYILHPILQMVFWASSTTEIYASRLYAYYHALAFAVVAFLAALPMAILLEIPLSKLARTFGL